jgi:hypothetical protein
VYGDLRGAYVYTCRSGLCYLHSRVHVCSLCVRGTHRGVSGVISGSPCIMCTSWYPPAECMGFLGGPFLPPDPLDDSAPRDDPLSFPLKSLPDF